VWILATAHPTLLGVVRSKRSSVSFLRVLAGLSILAPVVACGASVSQVYESDVRFERCLALDWQEDVRSDVRRRCWDDWVSYFAVGQPKDRFEYARRQIAMIDNGELGTPGAEADKVALPEPTSVFAPVPMMITAPTFGSAGPAGSSSAEPSARPASACEAKCNKSLDGCLSGCRTPVCEQYCAQKHGRCTDGCNTADDRR
jgi:hypothetical protein